MIYLFTPSHTVLICLFAFKYGYRKYNYPHMNFELFFNDIQNIF